MQQRLGYAISEQEAGVTLVAQPFLGGQTLEALYDCSRQYQPGVTPPPPPAVCVYNGTGLYILYTTARFQRPY